MGDLGPLVAAGGTGTVIAFAVVLVRLVAASGRDYSEQARRWKELLEAANDRAEAAEARANLLSRDLDELRRTTDASRDRFVGEIAELRASIRALARRSGGEIP